MSSHFFLNFRCHRLWFFDIPRLVCNVIVELREIHQIFSSFFFFVEQEAMSVTTNRTERSGSLINLGQIKAKLNAIPDWEYMLKDNS